LAQACQILPPAAFFRKIMKIKLGIILAGVAIVGLVVALAVAKKQSDVLHTQSTTSLLEFSNQLKTASLNLDDLHQSNLIMTNNLAAANQTFKAVSNQLAETSGQLARAKSEYVDDQSHLTDLNRLNGNLQTRNQVLDERATSLSNNCSTLNAQSVVLLRQLITSRSNYDFLVVELKKQMEQKAGWERRFNDLDEVRAQYNYLRFYGFY
jgi:chromosome segregation ATPase